MNNLKNDRSNKNINQDTLEIEISRLERYIELNNVTYTLEMDHVFNLSSTDGESFQLVESRFFLNDHLEVIKSDGLMVLSLSEEEEKAFVDYFFEYIIFEKQDYYQSKKMSKTFYAHFKKRQQELVGVKAKSDFMKHTLMLCLAVKKNGDFNQNLVLQEIAIDYIKKVDEWEKVEAIEFSPLFEINEGETLKGYYFFYKFSGYKNELEDTTVVHIQFSPFYELVDHLEVEKPFNEYFNE